MDVPPVTIEVHISNGLPEAAVRESKDRVRSALINSRLDFPARVTQARERQLARSGKPNARLPANAHVAGAVGYRVLDRRKAS